MQGGHRAFRAGDEVFQFLEWTAFQGWELVLITQDIDLGEICCNSFLPSSKRTVVGRIVTIAGRLCLFLVDEDT